jgi:phenylpropionate dioxygenase-like ring-hydroxylating dioxygenase large terminal subunit
MVSVTQPVCTDPVIANQWHAVCATDEVRCSVVNQTLLLDENIGFTVTPEGEHMAWRLSAAVPPNPAVDPAQIHEPLPIKVEYGFLWVCLGDPPEHLFAMPEFDEPDRRNMNAGTLTVATSAPRAVENFLDLGHFPYVHEGLLGIEPFTEVVDYDVEVVDGEILASRCDFYVPKVGMNFDEPGMTRYRYRVPSPFCVMLYYDSALDPSREDIVGVWVQPMTAELVRAHNYMGVLDETSTDNDIKRYQLEIFAQDKPILENQYPKRLPLDPRAETPIRADKSGMAYRHLLSDLGVTYGVIPKRS